MERQHRIAIHTPSPSEARRYVVCKLVLPQITTTPPSPPQNTFRDLHCWSPQSHFHQLCPAHSMQLLHTFQATPRLILPPLGRVSVTSTCASLRLTHNPLVPTHFTNCRVSSHRVHQFTAGKPINAPDLKQRTSCGTRATTDHSVVCGMNMLST